MNRLEKRPTTPTLPCSPSAKTIKGVAQQASLPDKENRPVSKSARIEVIEEQVIGESTVTEGGFKRVVVSKALRGKALAEATAREVDTLAKQRGKKPAPMLKLESALPNAQPIKTSSKRSGTIASYSACTNRGIVRGYNEDRMSIILSLGREKQVPAYFFGLYDGHGGSACCDFLRDNLHSIVAKQSQFPSDPVQALRKGVKEAELTFLSLCEGKSQIQKSGSTLLCSLIIGSKAYIANVGDCRAVLSSNRGRNYTNLTRDHKPSDEGEQARILKAGGRVFQTISQVVELESQKVVQQSLGPLRVYPGRLSVSRTIGDIQAKLPRLGGSSAVVISQPEVTVFELAPEHDFILMCTDGIFDKMDSDQAIDAAWKPSSQTIHEFSGKSVENVVREAMNRKSADNLSALLIGLDGLEDKFKRLQLKQTKQELKERPIR